MNCRVKIFWHWLTPVNGGAADELFAIPVYFKLNVTSMDPDEWYAFDVEHCTQVSAYLSMLARDVTSMLPSRLHTSFTPTSTIDTSLR